MTLLEGALVDGVLVGLALCTVTPLGNVVCHWTRVVGHQTKNK